MRTTDRVLSVVLALAGFVLGILIAVEVVYSLLGKSGHVLLPYESGSSFLREHTWKSGVVVVIGVLIALVGVVLLVFELKRRRPDLVALHNDRPEVTATMSTRSVGRAVGNAVSMVSGVSSARSTVRRNKVVVTTRTGLRDAAELEQRARAAGQEALESLDLVSVPTVKVALSQSKDS